MPIYCELIGNIDPDFLNDTIAELQEQFYLILRKRKIKMTINYDTGVVSFKEFGLNDIRILSKEEALDSLRVKK